MIPSHPSPYRPRCIGVVSVAIAVLITSSPGVCSDLSFSLTGVLLKLVDSEKYNFTYAYAPSIMYAGGLWYAYFCSNGTGVHDWDHIRYSTSSDGTHWSPPAEILRASDDVNERDGEYYYLFYSGNKTNVQYAIMTKFRSRSPVAVPLTPTLCAKAGIDPAGPTVAGSDHVMPSLELRTVRYVLWRCWLASPNIRN
jgi:hypothetical protein